MALSTFSAFYYGLEISSSNNKINFLEPNAAAVELTATIDVGTYTYQELSTKIKTAMDSVGTLAYTIGVDRTTRFITIATTDNFELLISTGSQETISPFTILGFNGAVDLTGATTYTGDGPSGSAYYPQFILQDYTPSSNYKKRQDASVNQTSGGIVETVSFGEVGFFKMSFQFITDLPQDGFVIKNNASGVYDLNSFMQAITKKGKFEFMPDIDTLTTFHVVILEKVGGNSNGTGYELQELVGNNLPGYYKLTGIELREIV